MTYITCPLCEKDYYDLLLTDGGLSYFGVLHGANKETLAQKLGGKEADGQTRIRLGDVRREFQDSAFGSLEDFVDYVENRNVRFFSFFSDFTLTGSLYQKALGLLGSPKAERVRVDLNDPEQHQLHRFFRQGYLAEVYSAYLEARTYEEQDFDSSDDDSYISRYLDQLSALPLSEMEYVFIEEGNEGDLIAIKDGMMFVYEDGPLPPERYQQFPKHDYEELPRRVKDKLKCHGYHGGYL
ncbi:hypothetical protein HZC30_00185 [Candidatus Woesearchaeota archaeon]|nr:hypothetical protein [Candidatus Woesearchaeota archaeon]